MDNIKNTIAYLFDRPWDALIDNDAETDRLQCIYDNLIEQYGWEKTFEATDCYMRANCITGEQISNFAHLYWDYNCVSPRKVDEPYRFLGYLYYRVNLKPWLFDCVEVYEGLVYALLSGENDFSHNPFVNNDYAPESDPEIIAEVNRLLKEDANS